MTRNKKKFNLGAAINRRKEADKAASEPAKPRQPLQQHTAAAVEADLKATADFKAAADKLTATPYEHYKKLQRTDAAAAGEYWRENKDSILGCYNH